MKKPGFSLTKHDYLCCVINRNRVTRFPMLDAAIAFRIIWVFCVGLEVGLLL
ncbi:MAG: hypothetical protein HC785_26330 [Calothrix sp. CSU_2_0]|nr:hypothetical protein [Calothrix sp. CSU_2_0]